MLVQCCHTGMLVTGWRERERERYTYSPPTNLCSIPQSLFHIPRFCQLILSYYPPPLSSDGDSEVQEYPHCVIFVLELQKLFAFLHHSQRKYISPDLAIQVRNEKKLPYYYIIIDYIVYNNMLKLKLHTK